MSNARNISKLLNSSGQIPATSIADGAVTTSKFASGAITNAVLPTGSILQVVTATNFTDFAVNTTSETVYINPLITITPKKSNSLIVFSMTFNAYHSLSDYYTSVWLRRNTIGTAISSHPNDNSWGDWTTNWASMNSVGAHAQQNLATAWDYPGTTSAVNYLLTGKNYQASKSFQFWGSAGGIKITAMEIQQ
jgi:hypothetical protein